MEWQYQLISTYITVCDLWRKGVYDTVKRHSNNRHFAFTDEETITLYLFGVLSGHYSIKSIYDYANRHLRDWFPKLGGYEAFNYRLNKISDGFLTFCEKLIESRGNISIHDWVIDSLPIVLAGPKRGYQAKVASNLADKGYCASKDLYFYGVKLHCIGAIHATTIPTPYFLTMAPASASDNKIFKQISHQLSNGRIFADKAYIDQEHKNKLLVEQNLELLTPVKKIKNLFTFPGGDTLSTLISSIRQPIESLFNWLQEKTKIQNASKVRSYAGLMVHVFGKLAAALLALPITYL